MTKTANISPLDFASAIAAPIPSLCQFISARGYVLKVLSITFRNTSWLTDNQRSGCVKNIPVTGNFQIHKRRQTTRIRFLSESIFATSYELLGALQIFNKGRELVLLEQAHKPVDHLPLLDRDNSGHSIDIVLHGKLGQVVDVDNGKVDSALLSGDGGVKARCEHLAGTAPLGREVDHHWNLKKVLNADFLERYLL